MQKFNKLRPILFNIFIIFISLLFVICILYPEIYLVAIKPNMSPQQLALRTPLLISIVSTVCISLLMDIIFYLKNRHTNIFLLSDSGIVLWIIVIVRLVWSFMSVKIRPSLFDFLFYILFSPLFILIPQMYLKLKKKID